MVRQLGSRDGVDRIQLVLGREGKAGQVEEKRFWSFVLSIDGLCPGFYSSEEKSEADSVTIQIVSRQEP